MTDPATRELLEPELVASEADWKRSQDQLTEAIGHWKVVMDQVGTNIDDVLQDRAPLPPLPVEHRLLFLASAKAADRVAEEWHRRAAMMRGVAEKLWPKPD